MMRVENLHFKYHKAVTDTIKGIDFEIPHGTIFGFLGPSGAGKSTTQKIITGLLHGYTGEVTVMNRNLSNWKNNYYEHIGVGFELPNHYMKLTAKENLQFFASFYSKKVQSPDELLKMVGLENEADKKVESFSKGMKVRLNFVRALMHNPDILFFDEPTSGLDPMNAKKLKRIIEEQKQNGKTIFITTHNMYYS